MRRADRWIELADRLALPRADVVAVMYFLNMRRSPEWIGETLGIEAADVKRIGEMAKPLLRQSRRAVAPRPGFGMQCHYCGSENELTRDHVMPRSRGGTDDASNIVFACRSCNSAKGNRTPEEWLG